MNAPPIPTFKPYYCPNCGLPLKEPVEICPVCGERITKIGVSPPWRSILRAILLAILMIPTGLSGARFLSVASFSLYRGDVDYLTLVIGAFGLVLIGLAALCLIGIIKSFKR